MLNTGLLFVLLFLLLFPFQMASPTHDDREAVIGEVDTGAVVPDAGVVGSLEWKLRTSLSNATYSEEENGGSSLGNEELGVLLH